jgi:glycerol uptake facilitator-like aquaporin
MATTPTTPMANPTTRNRRPRPGLFENLRLDLQAAIFEFIGTTTFLLLGLGGIQAANSEAGTAASTSNVEHVLYISTCMGMSLLVSAWLFYRVTGAVFNPNVSLALLLTGVIGPVRFVLFCVAQLLGAIAGAALVYGLTPGPLAVKYVIHISYLVFTHLFTSFSNTLAQGINYAQGVFVRSPPPRNSHYPLTYCLHLQIEMFITAALVLSVLMLAAEKHRTKPFAPVRVAPTSLHPPNANPNAKHLLLYRSASVSHSLPPTCETYHSSPPHFSLSFTKIQIRSILHRRMCEHRTRIRACGRHWVPI